MNKIYIEVNEKDEVTFVHYEPFNPIYGLNKSEEQLLVSGYILEPFTEPTVEPDKTITLMYDRELNKVYFKVTNRSLTTEQQLELANQTNTQLMIDITNIEISLMSTSENTRAIKTLSVATEEDTTFKKYKDRYSKNGCTDEQLTQLISLGILTQEQVTLIKEECEELNKVDFIYI